MEIFEAFTGYLLGSVALSNLVGDRIFPDSLPEHHIGSGIVYQAIGGGVEYTLQSRESLKTPQYQFSCYGASNKEAYAVYKQLVKAFDEVPTYLEGLNIQFIEQLSEPVKDYEPETKRHCYKVDFQFYYTEQEMIICLEHSEIERP